MTTFRGFFKVMPLVCLSLLPSCGGTLGGNPPKTGTGLNFYITDAPVDDAKSVFIKIESISVKQESSDWVNIPLTENEEIDLLALQHGRSKAFAALETLPEGTYTEIRLILADETPARLIDKDGTEHALKIPSGSESGLKIKSSFVITPGVMQEMTIDFDLRKSVKLTGNGNGNGNGKYMMKPVLRLAENAATGSIHGTGANDVLVCAYSGASVTAVESECENAVTTGKIAEGEYTLSYLAPGTYTVVLFQGSTQVAIKETVEVKAREATELGLLPEATTP